MEPYITGNFKQCLVANTKPYKPTASEVSDKSLTVQMIKIFFITIRILEAHLQHPCFVTHVHNNKKISWWPTLEWIHQKGFFIELSNSYNAFSFQRTYVDICFSTERTIAVYSSF